MLITPEQIRAARALLRLEQDELARRTHVSVITIRRMEAVGNASRVAPATLEHVRRVLEQAGAEFIPNGVRQRRQTRPDAAARFDELRAISLRSGRRLRGYERLTEADLYDEDGLPA
ncbi:MAG TPA: XRE family transcriptional regulator [Acetobacteraceae bacterium]|jgi:transcriptional regulator with XRE-family HTH domain